jgi:holo-[acyl-carrier protein] synthase
MIFGIGTDIIETERLRQKLERKPAMAQKIFSERERAYCEKQKYPEQGLAARFAAKEAFLKALGSGWVAPMEFYEIEVLNNEAGKPYIELTGKTKRIVEAKGNFRMLVSLSHVKAMATAVVVVETLD